MKTKKSIGTNAKSRIIFFAAALTYNLLLGLSLKEFLVLSPMLLTFYLLSALPTFFLLGNVRSKSMRAVIFVTLFLILLADIVYGLECRRMLLLPAILSLLFEVLYFGVFVKSSRKDGIVAKIWVLTVAALIAIALFFAYTFVCKPENPYLINGGATLWDTQTEALAEEICAGCDTDAEKVQAFHSWIVSNFTYDHDCDPLIQYFNIRKTLKSKKGLCFDFSHLFAAFCRSQNIPCYAVDGIAYEDSTVRHTWNRVYFDGCWQNTDITSDMASTANGNKLYGFCELQSIYEPDDVYCITKIY